MANGLYNQFKDLRTEQYAAIYEKPIYPKNQYLKAPPAEGWLKREEATGKKNIDHLVERGVFTFPRPADGQRPVLTAARHNHQPDLGPRGAGRQNGGNQNE